MIALHNSVYGFAVSALNVVSKEDVLVFKYDKRSRIKRRVYKFTHPIRKFFFFLIRNHHSKIPEFIKQYTTEYAYKFVVENSPYELKKEIEETKQLIGFNQAIKMCKKHGIIKITKSQINAIDKLNSEIRNHFVHFVPGKRVWVFHLWDNVIYDSLEIIIQLVKSEKIKLTKEQLKRIEFYIEDIWEMCGDSWYFFFPDQIVISRCARIHNWTSQSIDKIIPIKSRREKNPYLL